MLKIEMKDEKDYIDVTANIKDSTLIENLTLLHIALSKLKGDYNLSMQEISDMYKLYKKGYKDAVKEVN